LSGLKVCVISFSDLRNDPRVRRQLFALKDKYEVIASGLNKSEIEGVDEFVITDSRTFFVRFNSRLTFLFARLFKCLYKSYVKKYQIKDIIEKKKASLEAAKALNAGKEMKKFGSIVRELVGN